MLQTISYNQIYNDLKEAGRWFNSLNIDTEGTRFETICRNIETINYEFNKNGGIESLGAAMGFDVAYYSLTESKAFVSIYKSFKTLDQNHLPKGKLKLILEGPFFQKKKFLGLIM